MIFHDFTTFFFKRWGGERELQAAREQGAGEQQWRAVLSKGESSAVEMSGTRSART